MASTIRHNRARGTHQIGDMSKIVTTLLQKGWSDEKICLELGMELDKVIRLKQISGLKDAFANHQFSKTWEEFENSIKDDLEKEQEEIKEEKLRKKIEKISQSEKK